MKTDRNACPVLYRPDQVCCESRRNKSGHILDAYGVATEILQVFSHFGKLFIIVNRAGSVANSSLYVTLVFTDGSDRRFHVPEVVQRIEYTKNIDTILDRKPNEFIQYIVSIMTITNKVLSPEEHLQTRVFHNFPQASKSFPGIFVEEADTGIKGGSSRSEERRVGKECRSRWSPY